jgi:hypothetical protein
MGVARQEQFLIYILDNNIKDGQMLVFADVLKPPDG